jgi:hypothetical protein
MARMHAQTDSINLKASLEARIEVLEREKKQIITEGKNMQANF